MKQTSREKEKNFFDKIEIYDEKIAPTVTRLMLLCNEYQLPMIVSVAISNDAHTTKYKTNVILSVTDLHLTDNRIAKALMALNDFEQELPPNVKNALKEIINYIYRMKGEDITAGKNTKTVLTDDVISRMLSIIEGGDRVIIPAKDIASDVYIPSEEGEEYTAGDEDVENEEY